MLEFRLEVSDWVHHLATQAGAFADIYGKSAGIGSTYVHTASHGPLDIVSIRYAKVPAPIISRARELNQGNPLRLGDWVREELAVRFEMEVVLHVERTHSRARIIEYRPGAWEKIEIFNVDSLFTIEKQIYG